MLMENRIIVSSLRSHAIPYNSKVNNIQIYASDRDAGVIEIAKANAHRAGVSHLIEFQHCALSASPLLQPMNKSQGIDIDIDTDIDTDIIDTDDDESTTTQKTIMVVTNPPLGKRISPPPPSPTTQGSDSKSKNSIHNAALLPLYQTFGHQLNKLNGVTVALIAKDIHFTRRMGLMTDLNVLFVTQHGGLTIAAMSNKTSHES